MTTKMPAMTAAWRAAGCDGGAAPLDAAAPLSLRLPQFDARGVSTNPALSHIDESHLMTTMFLDSTDPLGRLPAIKGPAYTRRGRARRS